MRSRCVCARVLLPFLAMVCVAQQSSTPEQEGPVTTLRTNTRLVVLDVVVTNKRGVPVRNLSKSDFTILEDGQVQTVATYEPPDRHAPPPVGESARTASDTNQAARQNDTAMTSSALTILVMDDLDTMILDQA